MLYKSILKISILYLSAMAAFVVMSCMINTISLQNAGAKQFVHSQNSTWSSGDEVLVYREDEIVTVSLNIQDLPLIDALTELTRRASVGLSFSSDIILDQKITASISEKPFLVAVNELFEGTAFEAILPPTRDVLVVREKEQAPEEMVAQEDVISGQVVDSRTGEGITGVHVIIEGTTLGTVTDLEGNFQLTVPSLQENLVFTFVGYEQQTIEIDGRTEINIDLVREIITGEEAVVVGYGIMRRSDVTGAMATVERREITEVGSYSMDNVLQGRVAGVNVSSGGFRPGQTSSIRIRGSRSFEASNAPLVVMDGIPIEAGLMELNPMDVESVEVLKDASATAIYGSRGANGVILITTRQADERTRLQVEYQGHGGPQWVANRLDLMDAETYAQFARDAYIARDVIERGIPLEEVVLPPDEQIFDAWALDALNEGRSADYQDLVFGTGRQQTHQLSIMGGTDITRFNVSGTYDDHSSPVRNNDYRRLTGRFNMDMQLSDRVAAGVTSHISNSLRHEGVAFGAVLRNSPMSNPFDEDGNPRMYDELGDLNPVFTMYKDNHLDQRERTRVIASAYAEIDLIPDRLTYRGMFSPDFRFRNDGRYRNREPFSDAQANERRRTSLLYENRLHYLDQFADVHRVNVTLMHSYQTYDARQTFAAVTGLPYEYQLYHNLGTGATWDNISTSLSEWQLDSYMVRSNYVYDDRYMLTLTGRVDGSSRLAAGNEYGFFPSGAIGWNIHNEQWFMPGSDFFSELKLRFSIGDVGNTAIGAYATLGQLNYQTNRIAFSDIPQSYYEHGDIPNPDLTWERSRTMDLGLDWAIMDYRLQGSIDVYQTNTYDLLMERQLPFTSAYSATLENIGETRNRGVEFTISSVNVHTSDLLWETDFNIAWNQNEIVSLYGGKEDDPGNQWFIGEPISVIWYWDWDGIWQVGEEEEAAVYGARPGDVRFVDQNNDGVIDDEDRVIRGDPFPNWIGGLTNRVSYRGFDMSVFVYASLGSMHYTATHSNSWNDLLSLQFVPAQFNQLDVNYWMPDNPSNEYERPRFDSQSRTNIQAYWDSSFIRVRNIQVGYSLPPRILSLLGGLRRARIYAMVENPYTWTEFPGYDPEGARSYHHPNYRSFYAGMQLAF